ncbi:MAG: sensor histidine kinase [Cyanobacteria bacterium J06627_8]
MTSRAPRTIFTTAPSIPKIFRYLEWASVIIHALRMLFPVLYRPMGYDAGWGDFLAFSVLGMFAIFSFQFPIHRPLWYRRLYIWVAISGLLATRLYSNWGLDLLLWLVLAKSWFLMSRREALFTTVAAGILWQWAFVQYFLQQFSQPRDFQADWEAFQSIPLSIQVVDIVLNGLTIFIVANVLIIALCLTVIAERKSRQREASLAQEVELLAADLERNRIARDIHDSLGHTLTSLDVQLELAQRLYERSPDRVQQPLDICKTLASQALQEVRRSVATLRHESFDLNQALLNLVASFNSMPSITVESKVDLPPLPLKTSHQLYCIVKEGLENIRRHSHATHVRLEGQAIADTIELTISDNGVGFDRSQPPAGFGLRGIYERAQLISGQVTIDSAPTHGTTIRIQVPQ